MYSGLKVWVFLSMLLVCTCVKRIQAQDSLQAVSLYLQEKYTATVNEKLDKFQKHTDKYSRKALDRMIRQEKKMQSKIAKTDSLLAKKLFSYSIDSLQKFKAHLTGRLAPVQRYARSYFPYIDTVKQSLKFLGKAKDLTGQAHHLQGQLHASLDAVNGIESKLGNIENLEHFITARQEMLKQQLQKYPQLTANLKKINKQAYYYSGQIKQYKEALQDPSKIEETVLRTVEKLPAFQQLLQQQSALSGMFASPSLFSSLVPGASVPVVNGLPSRASLQAFMQSNIPSSQLASAVQRMTQPLPGLATGLNQLQNKLNQAGGMGDQSLPDFKPNSQRTRSLWKRLEYGADFQFGKSVRYLPATAALAVKLGYKLNDKSSIGTGASYVMGLGSGWKNIRFSTQGIGLRTYLTWKLKKGLDVQGGSEWNYLLQLNNAAQQEHIATWQQSALLGLRKSYATGKKLKGNIQVLYDFLHNRHQPASQPILFRFGYSF